MKAKLTDEQKIAKSMKKFSYGQRLQFLRESLAYYRNELRLAKNETIALEKRIIELKPNLS